jgi:PAS domain S-box-containing protein
MSAVESSKSGQAPAQIRSLEDQLRRITENARDVIGLFDVEGNHLYVNAPGLVFVGPPEELDKGDPFQHIHSEDRERIRAEYAEIVRSGEPRRLELRALTSEGEIRLMQSEANPVRDASGRVIAVLGIARDVTELADHINERKRLERERRESEELLEAIFEHAPIGIALSDTKTRILRANPRYQQLLGYTEEELQRLTGWDVTYAGDHDQNRRLREELFAGKRSDYTWEKRYVAKGGKLVWARNTVTLVRDANGAPLYALALVEDITERRLTDAVVRETADKLQALTHRLVELQEKERRDISRELHDRVGQTLTAMRINMDLIRTRLAERDDAVIRARNDDSLQLIESAFKSVENVMYELRPPMIDEYGIIAPLQWYAKKFSDRTGIEVEVRGDEDWRCGPEVELALFRIAQEALNNVVRHARARHVVIELQETSSQIVLTIQDDGVGFDREDDRAERAGYGFSTMRERAEAVRGTFEARSEKGKGTRITVKVPRRP